MTDTRRSAVSSASVCFWLLGGAGLLLNGVIMLRMAAEVNRLLPPERRISLIAYRRRFSEIKQLHEEFFPVSKLRSVALALIVISTFLVAIGVFIEVAD